MKLNIKERVLFEKNPIREVIAQIQFPENFEIQDTLPVEFQKEIADEFPLVEVQEFSPLKIGNTSEVSQIDNEKQHSIYNFISIDKLHRVSLASNYIALTCSNYKSWETFFPKLHGICTKLIKNYSSIHLITRIGLRYINLIDKEKLGIEDKKWVELIPPEIIGHLAHTELFDGSIEEANLSGTNNISQVKLEDFSLTLQTAFAQNRDRFCFFIDSDCSNKFSNTIKELNIHKEFGILHDKSYSVFRNCITESLYNALGPTSKN